MTSTTADAPNHHGHHPGFSGPRGLVAALSMTVGRAGDAQLAARLVALTGNDTVIDVGCGPGAAVRHAANVGANVIGVDPAPVMLRVARLLTRRSPHVRYLRGTAEELPVPDASATAVWSIAAVHHWPDLDAGLHEVTRVLAPDGRFVALERRTQPGARGHASHGWTDAQAGAFAERCRAAGFEHVVVGQDTTSRGRILSVLAAVPRRNVR